MQPKADVAAESHRNKAQKMARHSIKHSTSKAYVFIYECACW